MGSQLTVVAQLAERFAMQPVEFEQTVRKTVCPGNITSEQFVAFLMVAREYRLNPIVKQIYAFPAKGGGIVPVVSIDGWLKVINDHPQFNGMEFADNLSDGKLVSITCRMYRKDRDHPTEVTEYMVECVRGTDTWKQWPARMLRHKATIQAARYAFGLSGIYDQDEAERMGDSHAVAQQIAPSAKEKVVEGEIVLPACHDSKFEENLPKWQKYIDAGIRTPDEIIAIGESKYALTEAQKDRIRRLAVKEEGVMTDAEAAAIHEREMAEAA